MSNEKSTAWTWNKEAATRFLSRPEYIFALSVLFATLTSFSYQLPLPVNAQRLFNRSRFALVSCCGILFLLPLLHDDDKPGP
jgi:hypothetical protein